MVETHGAASENRRRHLATYGDYLQMFWAELSPGQESMRGSIVAERGWWWSAFNLFCFLFSFSYLQWHSAETKILDMYLGSAHGWSEGIWK